MIFLLTETYCQCRMDFRLISYQEEKISCKLTLPITISSILLQDNKYILDENKDSLLRGEVHMTPPLQRHFKKPPPNKNRRKPSKGHLQRLNSSSPPPPTIPPFVPPLELPCHYDDSPIPSAPSGQLEYLACFVIDHVT